MEAALETIYVEPAQRILPFFDEIRALRSTKKFWRSEVYRAILPDLKKVLDICETGSFSPATAAVSAAPEKPFRAVSWNIERGMRFEGILEILGKHPEIASADLFLLPETDVGMARSRNKNVARELAQELGMNYSFTPCYLNLDKGNGPELEIAGSLNNAAGIHGNALLSRWPVKNPRQILLKNCKDKLRGREKRLGSQRALVADIALPGGDLRVVCLHLDAHSSQRQREGQMRTIVEWLEKEDWRGPTLMGGDWNTSTYYASHAFFAFFSFWRRVAMGPKYVNERHYPHPERYFEKRLFDYLEARGFDFKNCNALGVTTMHYHLDDDEKKKNMRDWTPSFFQFFVDWAVKKAEGMARFKLDWFTAKNLKVLKGSPRVIGNLTHNGRAVSDHDAISVDFVLPTSP